MSEELTLAMERRRITKSLFQALDELPKQAETTALAERDYRVAAKKRTLELKQAGYPVTVIDAVVKGDEEIAELRFTRDVERELYKIKLERINVLKIQLRYVQDDIRLEWQRAGMAP